jgi:hypothetical protein
MREAIASKKWNVRINSHLQAAGTSPAGSNSFAHPHSPYATMPTRNASKLMVAATVTRSSHSRPAAWATINSTA